jgi:hypothetical protein
MPASKTIYVDKDGKKVSVIGDPSKFRKPKDIKELREKTKTIEVDTPFKKKPKHVQPDPRTAKGVRKALRGGGRAYGRNS